MEDPSNNLTSAFAAPFNSRQPDVKVPVVLIVDSNDDNRLMLKTLLQIWKYQVIEAADGIEAVKIIKKTCPDLILMDVGFPKLDGFSVSYHLRQSEKTLDVPIVFLSSCAEPVYKKMAKGAGGDEYLTKPLDYKELEKTLARYINRSEMISI